MAEITPKTVTHIAALARIGVHEDWLGPIAAQMATILRYVEQLAEVDTEGVEPTTHVLALRNVLREDAVQPTLGSAVVSDLAPTSHPPFITVPKVIGS